METLKKTLLIFIIGIYSCNQSSTTSPKSTQILLRKDSINEKEIYEFMQVVIADQKLRKENGITLEPQPNCDLTQDDKEFLKTLLIDTIKQEDISDTVDLNNITFTSGQFDKCLTTADIDFMLQQKNDHSDFKWDNSRLSFNTRNNKYWYVFSIPLLSKDKTKAIMMIRDLCKGLCGSGWTVLFKKENNQWISQTGNRWLH